MVVFRRLVNEINIGFGRSDFREKWFTAITGSENNNKQANHKKTNISFCVDHIAMIIW